MEFKKQLENEAHWAHVFSPANFPHKTIKPGSHYKTLPGWFPSSKSVNGLMRTSQPLMHDLFIHLDTNPDVVAIAEFPEEAEYWTIATNGEPVLRSHVPAAAVKTRAGHVVVFDVEPVYVQEEHDWLPQRTADLKAHYAGLGAHYHLLDERTIHLRPVFDNLRLMWLHKRVEAQHPDIDVIAQRIVDSALPLRIGDLMRRVTPNAFFGQWEGETTATMIPEVNPIFTAVMQLAMAGRVEVDLNRPFSQWTVVRHPSHALDGRRARTDAA
ncbi:hypothetical protein SZ54_3088 [Rhizobium sp. UR51a]|nr:hypothetical protein SZ54_3088 [Rhizobium sp. UR51a]